MWLLSLLTLDYNIFNKYTQDLLEAVLRLTFCACILALAGARVWYALLALELQEHFGRL